MAMPESRVMSATSERIIGSTDDMFDANLSVCVKGSGRRQTAATAMNSVSSRSHAIFTILIEGSRREESISECSPGTETELDGMPVSIRAKFHLVDLAGSERSKKTDAVGQRMNEGIAINQSLLALGNVIAALGKDQGPDSHISYRDSKLTRLLQDSLGGNSHTLMIACVSPADSNIEESINTLRYADRARKIKNKPIVNQGNDKEEVLRLRRENADLKMQLTRGGGGGGSLSELDAKELVSLRESYATVLRENKELTGALTASLHNANMTVNLGAVATAAADRSADSSGNGGNLEAGFEPPETDEEHAKSQAALALQLQNINDMLDKKEQLASTMMVNEEKFTEMREKYEESLAKMQEELATLQQERDKLEKQGSKAPKSNDPACKISEQRRKRNQELEAQITEMKKKIQEQSRMLKASERTEKEAKKLRDDISQMKSNKVKLIKQMKDDSEKNRVWKQQKEKEVAKLKQVERKQQVQIAKMENMHVKQQNVMKRKVEEASMANKRLQDLIQKQKNAKKMKAGMSSGVKPGLKGAAERIRSMVNHEIDVEITVKEAVQSREMLITNRAELTKEMTKLKSQSRLTMNATDRSRIESRRKELQSELEAANTEIASLQRQIMEANKEEESVSGAANGSGQGKSKAWIEQIQTVSECKMTLQFLFEKTTDLISENATLKSERMEAKQMFSDASASVRLLELELKKEKQEKDEEILQLKLEYEQQNTLLLSKFNNPDFEVKEAEMAKMSQFHNQLKKTVKKKTVKKEAIIEEDEEEDEMDEEEEDSDDEDYQYDDDPDWRQTPLFRRLKSVRNQSQNTTAASANSTLSTRRTLVLPGNASHDNSANSADEETMTAPQEPKRKSGQASKEACQCKKSGCNTNRCACKKGGRVCGEACKCVGCTNNSDSEREGERDRGVEDCTAGTMSLLSATFDISELKENVQPSEPAENARKITPVLDSQAMQNLMLSPQAPQKSTFGSSPVLGEQSPNKRDITATPRLSKACDVTTPAASTIKNKRKTIFQSPMSESNDSPVNNVPRPIFKTPMAAPPPLSPKC